MTIDTIQKQEIAQGFLTSEENPRRHCDDPMSSMDACDKIQLLFLLKAAV